MDASLSAYTDKQCDIISRLNKVLDSNLVRIRIDCDGASINNPVSVDVEHDELGNMVCIGVYDAVTKEAHIFTKITDFIKDVLGNAQIIAHNGVTDIELLQQWDIPVSQDQLIWDTMLMGHIIDSSLKTYGLKDMAKRELGIEYPSYDEIVGKRTEKQKNERITLDKQPLDLVAAYNALDCFVTERLYAKQLKGLY